MTDDHWLERANRHRRNKSSGNDMIERREPSIEVGFFSYYFQ